MGQLAELFVVGLLIVGGFYVWKHPEILDEIKTQLGNIGNKTGGNTNTGGNTTEEKPKEEEEEEEPKKSKFVAVYSSKPQTVVRTPSTIY